MALGSILLGLCVPMRGSLAPEKRFAGKLITSVIGYRQVLKIKGFTAYCILYALAMTDLFAYISTTPFIVQDIYRFSELQ